MTDKPFRVLLDVTDLDLENFKYVWLNVSPRELKTIFDFKKYILRKINLEKDVQLFVRDGLLLDEETVLILREDDTVKVKHKASLCQNSEKGSEKESANFSRKRNLSESQDQDINLKRYKPEVVTLSSNENEDCFIEKKSKKSENVCFTSKEKRKKQKESPINSADQSKRKYKRCKKLKKSSVSAIDSCDITDNSKSFSENINDSFRGKHILYLSPDRNEKSNCLNDASEICNLSSDAFVLQEEKLSDIQSQDYTKMSTPAQANNCGVPDLQLSMMPKIISISSCNENNSEQNDKLAIKNKTVQNNTENKSAKQLYEDLPNVNCLPDVGTCIAYKMLELDENYTPTISDYREGIVEKIYFNVEEGAEEIEIRRKKEVILPGKSGKFENLGKDEVPEPTVKTYDVVLWSHLISPKRLSGLLE